MSLFVAGLGTALPTHSIGQNEALEFAIQRCCQTKEQAAILPALYRRTQVQNRGSVLLENASGEDRQTFFRVPLDSSDRGPETALRMERFAQEAPSLALSASQRALAESGIDPARISQIVTVSCTGFLAPGIDVMLMRELKLNSDIGRTHVGFMGCHGALNGLRVAGAYLKAHPDQAVLISSVELCSLHFFYGWDPEKIVANALFSDGAATIIAVGSDAAKDLWQLKASGSCVFPNSEDAMSWKVGNHGFEMTLSSAVPGLISTHLKPWIEKWLASHGLTISQIGSWGIHPGGPRVMKYVQQSLNLPENAARISEEILAQCGNMSSATLLFVLSRLRKENAARPCVMLGFGPGLAVEAALLV